MLNQTRCSVLALRILTENLDLMVTIVPYNYTAIKGSGDDDDDDDDDDGGCCDIDIVMVMMIVINVEKNFDCSVLLFPVRLVGKYFY